MANKNSTNSLGTFASFGNGAMAAIVYHMIYVALMVATDGIIKADGLALPAVFLFLVISLVQYITNRYSNNGNSQKSPSWLSAGAFIIAVLTAVGMTIVTN